MQSYNPILPSYEYLADCEPYVFEDRVYLYGSHDRFNSSAPCRNDLVCWSANINDLANWHFDGVIFHRNSDPNAKKSFRDGALVAPDVQKGPDGRFYLYYALGFTSRIGVAVCDTPSGEYSYLGEVHYPDGMSLGSKGEPFQSSPSVLVDNDGQVYLYTGYSDFTCPKGLLKKNRLSTKGAMVMRLRSDMITIDSDIEYICPTPKNSTYSTFEGHEFLISPSMRKYNGIYYLIYTSVNRHELCYAMSEDPMSGFIFGGVLLSTADIGVNGNEEPMNYYSNAQGTIARIKNRIYVFYQRQTNRNNCSRQVCADEVTLLRNGRLEQSETTSIGLNGKPLQAIGTFKARTACHLYSRLGARMYKKKKLGKGCHPYFTQTGKDRNHTPSQHIANFCHGATAGFKYFQFDGANQIIVTIKGNPKGKMIVSDTPDGRAVAKIRLTPCKDFTEFYASLVIEPGKHALYFTYEGTGKFIFKGFTLQEVVRGNVIK